MQFKLTAFTALLAMATLTAAAPAGGSQRIVRELAHDVAPALRLAQPVLEGLNAGPAAGDGKTKSVAQVVQSVTDPLASDVADVVADATADAGHTEAQVPGAVLQTLHDLENGLDVTPVILGAIFGDRRALVAAQSA